MEKSPDYSFILLILLLAGFLFFSANRGPDENDKNAIYQLMAEDSSAIQTLASYPELIRNYAFEVSTMPQELVKLNEIQRQSGSQFKSLLSSYPKEEQLKIWNLTRYDGLIDSLILRKMKSGEAMDTLLKYFPKEVYDDALYYTAYHFDLLLNMNKIKRRFNQSLEQLIKQYPPETKTAFRQLLESPEILSLLYTNMLFTVRLGNLYQKKPQFINRQFESINQELTRQKASEDADWNQKMKDAPTAQSEIQLEIKEFVLEYGYKQVALYNDGPDRVEIYVNLPYPYWCGYPWWSRYAPWFIFPYWHHSGFYFRLGNIVWLGPPSFVFLKWHFQNDLHIYYYPNVTNSCIQYYSSSPQRHTSESNDFVRQWVIDHKKYFAGDFTTNDKERVSRLKEYGKFIMDFDKQVNIGLLNDGQADEFLREHISDYPHLQLQPAVPTKCPAEQPKAHPKYFQKGKQHS